MKKARCLSLLALFGIAASAYPQIDPQRDFVLAGKDAFMILPPEFVCGPKIRETAWSPDGQHLAVRREFADLSAEAMTDMLLGGGDKAAADPETQILVYSLVTHKVTKLLALKRTEGEIMSVDWISGSSSLVLRGLFPEPGETVATHTTLMILNSSGQTITVHQFDQSAQFEVFPSPFKPVVVVVEHPVQPVTGSTVPRGSNQVVSADPKPERQPASIRFFGTDGILSEPMRLPGALSFPFWSDNGQLYVLRFEQTPGSAKSKRIWYLVDRAARTIELTAAPPDGDMIGYRPPASELKVEDLSAKISLKKLGIYAPAIVLSTKEAKDSELSVVSTDGYRGELAAKDCAVSYETQGSLMVRPMVKVPLEAYKKARDLALRAKAVNQAKQVALAMIMYSNDYDDNYVANNPQWQSQLEPYLKDMSLMDGFNYTFAGGNAASIANPADTQIGYIDGPGGRAVAYADGHVKWVPNP